MLLLLRSLLCASALVHPGGRAGTALPTSRASLRLSLSTGVAVVLTSPLDGSATLNALGNAVRARGLDVVVAAASDTSGDAAEQAFDSVIAGLPPNHAVAAVFLSPTAVAAVPPEAAIAIGASCYRYQSSVAMFKRVVDGAWHDHLRWLSLEMDQEANLEVNGWNFLAPDSQEGSEGGAVQKSLDADAFSVTRSEAELILPLHLALALTLSLTPTPSGRRGARPSATAQQGQTTSSVPPWHSPSPSLSSSPSPSPR